MNTKIFAICLNSIRRVNEGEIYDLDVIGASFRVYYSSDRHLYEYFDAYDERFCFVPNATRKLETKLKGGTSWTIF